MSIRTPPTGYIRAIFTKPPSWYNRLSDFAREENELVERQAPATGTPFKLFHSGERRGCIVRTPTRVAIMYMVRRLCFFELYFTFGWAIAREELWYYIDVVSFSLFLDIPQTRILRRH